MFSDVPELARVLSQCFGGSKVCFEEEQTVFATSFYHIAQLALAADELANNRQASCEVGTPALGWLLIANNSGRADKESTAELLGHSDHPFGKLGEIAEALLRPLADDALAAQAEDDEL